MNTILAISLITFKEGLRYRILYGIVVCAIFMMISSLLISGFFMRDIVKVTLDICLAAVTLGGLLVPFFLTITLLARDIENKTIYTLLAKTVSRKSYIIGRYLGLSLLTLLIMSILTVSTLITTFCSTLIYPDHFFKHLSYIPIVVNLFAAFFGVLVLNSVVFLWCSLLSSSFLATLLTISTYVIGQSVEEMVYFMSQKTPGVEISPITQGVVKLTLYIFPNLAAFDVKLAAAHSLPLHYQELLYLTIYGVSYIAVMLFLSIRVFQRRDLA